MVRPPRPIRPVRLAPAPRRVSRNAGAFRGSLSAWRPPMTVSLSHQAHERRLTQERAADLAANDWAASSGVNAITTNAVGTGLRPQSRLNFRRLGISRDAALELQTEIEAVWKEWVPLAHVRGMLHFEDLQFLGLRTMLRQGEMLHLPVMVEVPGRPVGLAIQDLSPLRLRTPIDKFSDASIVDGVQRGSTGAPEWYWLATPSAMAATALDLSGLPSSEFSRVPARVGHRPGCFHLFRYIEDEQVRGESVFSPGINLYRHLSDSLDNELLAQVVTASLALFIAREPGATGALPEYLRSRDGIGDDDGDDRQDEMRYTEVRPGTVLYGNRDEKPYMLESSRPSPNFSAFSEFVLRAMAASIDMPYEVLAKDFSKTNYSSARAALLEAWRVYMLYRSWLVRHYCQPIWSMVIEEAWLSGRLVLPAGAPDFYDAISAYTNATWIGPSRGYVDPVKEIVATAKALDYHLMTHSEALAELGRDFEETMDELAEEAAIKSRIPALNQEPTHATPA